MQSSLSFAILAHAAALKITLDLSFPQTILTGYKNVGVLNPKIPNSFVKAELKTLSPKVTPSRHLPGISAFSVPVAQKYDYAGGNAGHFRAFRFLLSPFSVGYETRQITIIDDALVDGPASKIMLELCGGEWAECVKVLREHVTRDVQSPAVNSGEKQIFWVTDHDLLVSPLADTLPAELSYRISERKDAGQMFRPLYFYVGGESFQNCGVLAARLGGALPKLMSFPPPAPRDPAPLPEPQAGHYLALEFDAVGFNATGASIAGGLGNITGALGFAEAFWRKLAGHGLQNRPRSIALGFSNVNFHGHFENGRWTYSTKKGVRTSAKGGEISSPVADLTANARVHVVFHLAEVLARIPDTIIPALATLRFAGGSIFNAEATSNIDLEAIMAAWGDRVWFVADRQADIEADVDKLDAALDRLAITEVDGEWKAAWPRYALASTGFQAIEPPRPRRGLRDDECRHVYAAGVVSLMEWIRASNASEDAIFWRSEWDRERYACTGKSSF